jgi:hypothetical protein
MKSYYNLALSSIAGGVLSATAVASTTRDLWTVGVALASGTAVALVQHMRHRPEFVREREVRKAKEADNA